MGELEILCSDAPQIMGDGDEEPVDDLRQKKKNKDEDDEGGLKFYLKSVVFSGAKYHVVTKDPSNNTDQVYPTPHWEDNSEKLDGDAEDDGDKKYPVCYESGIEGGLMKWENEALDSVTYMNRRTGKEETVKNTENKFETRLIRAPSF